MKTLQQIFDQAYNGVVAQGGQSSDTVGRCMYRGPEGRKCAVGHLLPDELYRPNMEGTTVDYGATVLKASLRQVGIDLDDKPTKLLVIRMQAIHDDTSEGNFLEEFKQAMQALATENNLKVPS